MKYLLSFFIIIASQLDVIACDCAFSPKTFMTSIMEYTAEFEVVKMDTLATEGLYKYWPLVLTKLKVIKSFNDSIDVDYVWMNNTSGTDCERGLFPDHIGQKYIITGRFIEGKRYDRWIDDSAERNFLYASTCGKMVLDVEGNNVIGVITKHNNKKIKEKYDLLMKEDESKATAYYEDIYNTRHHPDRVQTMPLNEFYKLMELR